MSRRVSGAVAGLMALALVAGGCTSEDQTGTGAGGDGSGGGSTVGLTDDTIRIAYIGADFGALAEAGVAPDLGDQDANVQALVEEINDSGGIAGRRIEVNVELVDGTAGPEVGQAACLAATQEFQAFVVMLSPAISRDLTRCTSVTNETLTIVNTGWDDGLYEEAEGRLFSIGSHSSMSANRQARGWVDQLEEAGMLEGKTIGVVTTEQTAETAPAIEDDLIPRLEELGHDVAEYGILPCPEGDIDCEQHEAAVQRMKDAGVDLVFMNARNLAGPTFVQAAKNLDFAPQWTMNANETTKTVSAFFDGVKDWWDGAIGSSSVYGHPDQSETAHECNEVISERSGVDYPEDEDSFGFASDICIYFRVLQEAADSVEGDLDQATLIEALEGVGEVPSNAGPPGSLGPDKHDAGDWLFLCEYRASEGACVARDGTDFEVE